MIGVTPYTLLGYGNTIYPLVPGYEITGIIEKVRSKVNNFKIGEHCTSSQENYCEQFVSVYNSIFWDGSITYGGYSTMLVADHRHVKFYT
ncbi:hypothetical protein KY285_032678 [Solanum tuberosum]|nr:hypothetical protein KY289_032784 [Solanum tuberosum]KAH0647430.1 hypothetical protein KY285_032678 [Solanum tuberosum]